MFMKILAIGDFHGKLPKKLPKKDIDLILLVGDLGNADLGRKQSFKKIENPDYKPTPKQIKKAYLQSYISTIKILKKLNKISKTFLVYGNVESTDKETKELSKKIKLKLPLLGKEIKKLKNIYNISKKTKKLKGISIAGYPYFVDKGWAKRFRNKKYLNKHKGEDKDARDFFKILKKVDILLIHQPPYKILDKVNSKYAPKDWQGKHAGSKIILNYIKKYSPNYAICGHIHEAKGEKKIGKTKVLNLGMRGYKVIEIK